MRDVRTLEPTWMSTTRAHSEFGDQDSGISKLVRRSLRAIIRKVQESSADIINSKGYAYMPIRLVIQPNHLGRRHLNGTATHGSRSQHALAENHT